MPGVDTDPKVQTCYDKGEAEEVYFDQLVDEIERSIVGTIATLRMTGRHCINTAGIIPNDHPLQDRLGRLENLAHMTAEDMDERCHDKGGQRWLA